VNCFTDVCPKCGLWSDISARTHDLMDAINEGE
jgi:hypothetical protein